MVYLIRSGAYVKIGVTDDLAKRIYGLEGANPHELVVLATIQASSDYTVERKLHLLFAKHRHRREWFHYAPEIAQFVEALRADGVTLSDGRELRHRDPEPVVPRAEAP